jgi:hypothetical protein
MKADQFSFGSAETGVLNRIPPGLHYLSARLAARDTNGEFLSVLTGHESDAELRAIALQFVETCPVECSQAHCPFRILGNLYHVSSRALINSMSRNGLVSLFESGAETRECPLRSPAVLSLNGVD